MILNKVGTIHWFRGGNIYMSLAQSEINLIGEADSTNSLQVI